MVLSEEQMEKLRIKELEILLCFIRVCEQLEIKYFVVQGTLLGAVRHHGFIPWDDDIDVGMLREDYEIFIKKGQELLPDEYFIQTHYTDPSYPHGFAKIRNIHTTFLETTCKDLPMNHGVYIDVFPFDYYPDNWIVQSIFEIKKLLLRYRIRCALYIPSDQERSLKNIIRSCLKKLSMMVYPSLTGALDKQCELYKSVPNGKYRINNGSPWGKKECIPATWLNEVTTLKFEGVDVKVPLHYKEYLTHVYGDYMKLPPPEKRIPHHFISAINFTRAYTDDASSFAE